MRAGAYLLFEVLAWAAGALGACECLLRIALGETNGLGEAGLFTLAAAGVVFVAGERRRVLIAERGERTHQR